MSTEATADSLPSQPVAVLSSDGLGPLPPYLYGSECGPLERVWTERDMREYASAAVTAERERWQRIAAAAQAVTRGAEDIGDFLVSSSLMAALALALDEGPNV